MRKIETQVYTFDELSDQAKEKARDWWRECIDLNDYDAVIDDAVHIGELLGIEITPGKIFWSGFSSQGDGASFEGSYRYQKGAVKSILSETGAARDDASKGDMKLLRIAKGLQEIQKTAFYSLTATTKQSGHYMHSGCMNVDVSRSDDKEVTEEQEETLTRLLRDFADWIYSQLDLENDYIHSDENVDESIRINEYEFTEDGKRF